MKATTSAELREKLDRVQAELSSRKSTTYFARAAIAILTGLIIAGASAKLFHDAIDKAGTAFGAAAATVSLSLALYALVQYLRGRTALRGELIGLEELTALRRELRLDDPPSLLPSR